MKLHHHLVFIVLPSTVACSKTPNTSTETLRLEERPQKMEAQLARIESAVAVRTGQEDKIVEDKSTFKDVILADGDVVVVPQSMW